MPESGLGGAALGHPSLPPESTLNRAMKYTGQDSHFDIFVLQPKAEEIPEDYVQVNLDWRADDLDGATKAVQAREVAEIVNDHRPDDTAIAEAIREDVFPSKTRFRDGKMEMDIITYETFREWYLEAVEEAIGSRDFDLEQTITEGGVPGLPERPSDIERVEEKIQQILDYVRRERGLEIFHQTGAVIVTSNDSSWTDRLNQERMALGYAINQHWDNVQSMGYVVTEDTLESLSS